MQARVSLTRQAKGPVQLAVHQVATFQPGEATLNDLPVVITKVSPPCGLTNRVFLQQSLPGLPVNCVLHQKQSCTTVPEIDVAFQQFWEPFWSRDQDASEHQWREAEELILHKAPNLPAISLPWQDLDAWEFTIARTNAKSAPGTCGWRYSELKLLPKPAIQHLAKLFQQVIETAGFTASFMTARTVLLAKVEQPQHIGHGRPITILSTLVRLFSKFAADRILAQWASVKICAQPQAPSLIVIHVTWLYSC